MYPLAQFFVAKCACKNDSISFTIEAENLNERVQTKRYILNHFTQTFSTNLIKQRNPKWKKN